MNKGMFKIPNTKGTVFKNIMGLSCDITCQSYRVVPRVFLILRLSFSVRVYLVYLPLITFEILCIVCLVLATDASTRNPLQVWVHLEPLSHFYK